MRQSGSSSIGIMGGIGVLAIAGAYTLTNQTKVNKLQEVAEMEKSQEMAADRNSATLSIVKGLLSPNEDGLPQVAAYNYFNTNWSLRERPDRDLKSVSVRRNVVTFETVNPEPSYNSAVEIFSGKKSLLNFTSQSNSHVRLVTPLFNEVNPFLVDALMISSVNYTKETVNGQTTTRKKVNNAIIPIAVPEPKNVRLWVKAPGKGFSTTNFGSSSYPLSPGDYVFKLTVDGVAMDGVIQIDLTDEIILGEPGEHSANNLFSKNATVGSQTLYLAGPGKDYNFQGTSCEATFNGTVHRNYYNITAYARGVDGQRYPESGAIRKRLYVSVNQGEKPDFNDFQKICPNKCVYKVGDDIYDKAIHSQADLDKARRLHKEFADYERDLEEWERAQADGDETRRKPSEPSLGEFDYLPSIQGKDTKWFQAQNRDYFDIFTSHTHYKATEEWKMYDAKVCYNIGDPLEKALAYTGGNVREAVHKSGDYWGLLDYYYYAEPDCKRNYLMQRGGCGCFADHVTIKMADGSDRLISKVTTGDLVYNPLTKKAHKVLRVVKGPEQDKPMLVIKAGEATLEVTGYHPFPTHRGTLAAFDLRVGDQVRMEEGEWVAISSIKAKHAATPPTVWNLTIEGEKDEDHYVLAGGFVTGDLYIQSKLQAKAEGFAAREP